MSPSPRIEIWKWMCVMLASIVLLTPSSDADCQFPDELQGVWHSSYKGPLTFNGTEVLNYPIAMSATVSELNFNCTEQEGDIYLWKADRYVFTLNSNIRAYICIELHRVSEYKYYYYIGSDLSTISDYVYGVLEGTVVTLEQACDRAKPYEASTFVTLIKDGAVDSGKAESTCPSQLLANYASVLITDSTGSTVCSSNRVDGCNNRTALSYTYQACSSGLVFNTGGSVTCLYNIVSNGITYLHTWNNDATVDGSTTYRIVCYAIKTVGSTVYATVIPKFCSDVNQNEVTVSSPGIKIQLSQSTTTCVVSVTNANYAGFIALILIMLILITVVLIVSCILYKKLKAGDKSLEDMLCCRNKMQIGSREDLELSGRDFPRIKTAKLRKVI